MKHFTRVMKALSDPNRVKIVKILQLRGELCVCEIVPALGLAQPTVSKHLKILEDAELVERERKGSWVNYRTAKDCTPYARQMLDSLQNWLDDDADIKTALATAATTDREILCASNPQDKNNG